jgi:oxygen-dependent protoporphyrinogen oxidase
VNHAPSTQIPSHARSIAIVGGGITGLAAALRLIAGAPDARITLLEAGDRLGGVLQTQEIDGYLVEHSADMFITSPSWAIDLANRIGLGEELINTSDHHRRAFVVRRGKLQPTPTGFVLMQPSNVWSMLTTPLLSWRGKLRLGLEYFVPRKHFRHSSIKSEVLGAAADASVHDPRDAGLCSRDESLAAFARRRLGREAYENLVQPLVGGIYTADPEKLSLAATLPRFLDMERDYRSLIRAAWEDRKTHSRMQTASAPGQSAGVRYGMFIAPRRGMSSLIEAIAGRLSGVDIRLRTRVTALDHTDRGRWHVATSDEPNRPQEFDSVILATSAWVAAAMLPPAGQRLADDLRAIEYASTAIVCLGYPRRQIAHALDGFGFVVPAVERRSILAASFASIKFAERAPLDSVLFRVFIGGALQPELLQRDDRELIQIARREMSDLLGATGDPQLAVVVRWNRAMPQYHLGHLERIARIEASAAELPGLHLAGSAYRGVGIPHCIHSGQQAADRAVAPGDR